MNFTEPAVGGSREARIRSRVVLPEPLLPTTVTNSFSPISRETSRSASTRRPSML